MKKFILGRTGLEISRTGFGALPIQRVSFEEAGALRTRALDGGVTNIDTARACLTGINYGILRAGDRSSLRLCAVGCKRHA